MDGNSGTQANLDLVKKALQELKEKIDSAEEREIEAMQQKREADSKIEHAEEELESIRRRKRLLLADRDKTQKTLAEKQERLEHHENRTMADEEKRREYESVELERDDVLISAEEDAVIAKQQASEAAAVLMETERKLQVLITDLEKVQQRLDTAEAKEQEYMDTITRHGDELRELSSRDDEAAEREMEAEEKLMFLQEQHKQEVTRAEDAERDVVRNENILTSLHNDLNSVEGAHQGIGNEIGKIDELVQSLS